VFACICPQHVCSCANSTVWAEALEQLDDGSPRAGEQRVAQARDEEGDAHAPTFYREDERRTSNR